MDYQRKKITFISGKSSNIRGYKKAVKKYKEAIDVLKNVPGNEAKKLSENMTQCVNAITKERISPHESISLNE